MSHRFPPLAPPAEPQRDRSVLVLVIADLPWGELALASLFALLFTQT